MRAALLVALIALALLCPARAQDATAYWTGVVNKVTAGQGKQAIVAGFAQTFPSMITQFAINTPLRQAHFLAQLCQESATFITTTEFASGAAYEGRRDLGNTQPGDGVRFKGRGLLQITGRSNYAAYGAKMGVDLVSNPPLAANFPYAALSAGWYWQGRNINAVADRDDVVGVTRLVNGGTNGLSNRQMYLARAKSAIAAAGPPPAGGGTTTTQEGGTTQQEAAPTGPACTDNSGNAGMCINTASCTGTSTAGKCAGPANIQCCVVAAAAPAPTTQQEVAPAPPTAQQEAPAAPTTQQEAPAPTTQQEVAPAPPTAQQEAPAPPTAQQEAPAPTTQQEPVPAPNGPACTDNGGNAGMCINVASCTGTSTAGKCAGPASIQCCVVPTTTQEEAGNRAAQIFGNRGATSPQQQNNGGLSPWALGLVCGIVGTLVVLGVVLAVMFIVRHKKQQASALTETMNADSSTEAEYAPMRGTPSSARRAPPALGSSFNGPITARTKKSDYESL